MPIKWRKVLISHHTFEACGVFDVNNDGHPDIVSGSWWYEGPGFRERHWIGEVRAEQEYYDDFSNIPLDVDGDGFTDYLTGGWFGACLQWRQNPGEPDKEWPLHTIADTGNIERTCAWDVDGDGIIEIVPNTPMNPLVVYKLETDSSGKGTGRFQAHTISAEPQGHGLGFGDVSGSGRRDFVLAKGWFEAPADTYNGQWTWHPEFDLGNASVPIIVADVNGDGLNDLIVGQAHGYGLDWWEQRRGAGGKRTWVKHPIDPFNSQYHDMHWVDIDGDGACELVTGKRYRAHCGHDAGAYDDAGICYFKWNGESFSKQVIDYGPIGQASGFGIYAAICDLNGDGKLDIVAPGKDGLYAFFQEG